MLERDTQRGELNKVKQGQAEVGYDMEGTREEIHKLTQQINLAEQQLNRVSIMYRIVGNFQGIQFSVKQFRFFSPFIHLPIFHSQCINLI